MKAFALLASLIILPAVRPVAVPADAAAGEVRFSVHGMDCDGCARKVEAALAKVRGVKRAEVDYATKQGQVLTKGRGAEFADLVAAAAGLGYELLPPGKEPLAPLAEDVLARLDLRTASRGERVELASLLVPGKVTVVDYFAEWCAPCKLLERHLQRLVLAHDGLVAVRRVDIVGWDSAAAKQATSDFGLQGLPHLRIFGSDGRLLGVVQGNFPDRVTEVVEANLLARTAESAPR